MVININLDLIFKIFDMSFKYKLFPFQASLIFLKKCNYFTVMLYWPRQWPQRVLPLVLLEPAQVVEQPQQPQPRHHRSLLWRTRLLQLLREFLLICRIRTGEWILIYEIFQNCIIFTIFFFLQSQVNSGLSASRSQGSL